MSAQITTIDNTDKLSLLERASRWVQSWWRCPNYRKDKYYTKVLEGLTKDLPSLPADDRPYAVVVPWAKEDYERTLGWIQGLDAKAADAIRFDSTAAALIVARRGRQWLAYLSPNLGHRSLAEGCALSFWIATTIGKLEH